MENEREKGEIVSAEKAGREMDKLIAEKIFGVKRVFRPCDVKNRDSLAWGEDYHYIPSGKPPRTHMIDARPVPQFSTRIAAAWQIVEKVVDAGHVFIVKGDGLRTGDFDPRWTVLCDITTRTDAATAPLAICLAALKFADALSKDNDVAKETAVSSS